MKFNLSIKPFCFISAIILLGFFGFASAKEFNAAGANVSQGTPEPKVAVLTEKISEAIKLLKDSPPLLYETTNKNLTGNLVRKQIALAIFNISTGEIFQKIVWVKEADIKNYKKAGFVNLTPAIPGETLDLRVNWWNSFNSFYNITDHPELVVIANKYLLPSSSLYNLPERSKNKYTDIIYVPYSAALHLPEIISAGKNYLEKKIDQAYNDLDSKRVISHSTPGTLVTSDIGKDFIRNILLVEHVDPEGFNLATDGGLELTQRVLALIGLNQDLAYRYTGSPAGAFGIAQFIKSTYNSTVKTYPGAKLIKDYTLGMADHANAIKAMVLFFDNRKQEINNKVKRKDILNSLGITEEMLAAAYNGGGSRVATSVNKFGTAWITGQLNLPGNKTVFKKETINYLLKFQAIKNLNLFAKI